MFSKGPTGKLNFTFLKRTSSLVFCVRTLLLMLASIAVTGCTFNTFSTIDGLFSSPAPDIVAPVISPVTITIEQNSTDGTSTPVIRLPAASDNQNSEEDLKFEARVINADDDSTAVDWTEVEDGEQLSGLTLETDKAYYLEIRVKDVSGNVGNSVLSQRFIPGSAECVGAAIEAQPYAGGAGTLASPYLICTGQQLAAIAQNSANWSSTFKLVADVSMAGVTFDGIGTAANQFKGRFFGNNKRIKNLTINRTSGNNVGLFNATLRARITNLRLTNMTITATTSSDVGAVIGECDGTQIVNLTVENLSIIAVSNIGGIMGSGVYCDVLDATLSGTIVGTGEVIGGVVGGAMPGAYYNIDSTIDLNSPLADSVGGIDGEDWWDRPRFQNVNVQADVIGRNNVGGFTGANSDGAHFYRSSFKGNITGQVGVGGFAGVNWDIPYSVYSSSSEATITGNREVGGFSGGHHYRTHFYDSYVRADLVGTGASQAEFGGFYGTSYYGTIGRSYAQVNINSTAVTAGGGVGHIYDWTPGYTISDSFVAGNVTGSSATNSVSLFQGLNEDTDPLELSNTHYWSGATCTNLGGGGCNTSMGLAEPSFSAFYGSTHASQATWDFTNVWVSNTNDLPTLNLNQNHAPTLAPLACAEHAAVGSKYMCRPTITDLDVNEDRMILLQDDHTCTWIYVWKNELHGTPVAGDLGTCRVSLVATDGKFQTAVQSYNLTVHNGVAISPAVDFNAYYYFGWRAVAGGAVSTTFTITNNETTAISGLTISGLPVAEFFFAGGGAFPGSGGTCGATLAAGASCTAVLSFDPNSVGEKWQQIYFDYNNAAGAVRLGYLVGGYGL